MLPSSSVIVRNLVNVHVLMLCLSSPQLIITKIACWLRWLNLIGCWISLCLDSIIHRSEISFNLDLKLRINTSRSQNLRICLFCDRSSLTTSHWGLRFLLNGGNLLRYDWHQQLLLHLDALISLLQNLSSSLFPYLQFGVQFTLWWYFQLGCLISFLLQIYCSAY